MSQILKTFIGILIAGVTFVGVIVLIYNIHINKDGVEYKGIINIIGANAKIENTSTSPDMKVFKDFVNSPHPEITFDNTGLGDIVENEDYEILKFFKVKFNDQEELIDADTLEYVDFRIEDITSEEGISVLNLYDTPNKMINFNVPGIYTFTFYVIHNQKESTVKIKVPVN